MLHFDLPKRLSKLRIVLLLLVFSAAGLIAQTTIYTENMYNGTGGANGNAITVHESNDRFNEDGLTYSGTGDMRTTNVSSGYSGSSGTWNVMLNTSGETLVMDGLNLSSYSSITLSFGIRKGSTAENGSGLVVEYSTTGASGSYTSITWPVLPTGTGTATWHYRTSTSSIPNTATTIRFRSTNGVEFRIDDILIEGTAGLPSIALSSPAQTAASNISQSTTDNIITHFEAAVTSANATLNSLDFTTTGSYLAADLTGNFKLYYGTTNVFGSATQIATVASGAPGARTFTGLSQTINSGSTGFFWITADASAASGGNRTLTVSANPTLSFASGSPTGSISAGGTKTFVPPPPTLSVGTLNAFGAQCTGSDYGPESFTITGVSLSSADVTVAALSGYSYSTSAGGPFTSTLSLAQAGGAYSQTIYVRFSPVAVTTYNGNIVVGGGGASNQNVAASGSGVNTVPSLTSGSASSVTYNSATVAGSITSTGCTSVSAYGIEYSTTSGFTPGTGTQVASSNLSGGNFSSDLSGLAANTTYYYIAYATNAGGTGYGSEQSFTTNNLDAPVAIAGSSVGDFSFVANWDPVIGATGYRLDVSTTPFTSGLATDLIISEYVEGSSNNKYIEIFNGTGASVDLSDYRLQLFSNGSGSASPDNVLSGTLANNAVIVYKNSAATIYAGAATNNTSVGFNGDDAVALYKISTASYVDIFGRIGNDPGTQWTLGGNNTADQTLVRNADVAGGVTVSPTGTGPGAFTTLSTEWTEYAIDNVSNLGSHTFNAGGATYVPGYQDLAVAGTSQLVSGLSPNTTYYYRVRAESASSTSANSNEISVLTTFVSCGSGVNISSFTPSSGPAGTHVTITGTGFTSATSVTFNGQAATSFDIISDTEIDAVVPVGANSGLVRVADGGLCFDISASSFTFLNTAGTCTGVLSDIIISEIYDPQSGNNHYIEIFNGTPNTIDLNGSDDYSLRLLNKSSASDPSPTTYNLDITGNLASNDLRVYYAGANGGLASTPVAGFGVGFNEFDEIQLLKNGVIIDRIQGPNDIGYNFRRLTTVSGPNATYTAAEWAIVTTGETNADIGTYSLSSSFVITAHPSDDSAEPCDPLTFSVTSSNPSVTYQWYKYTGTGTWGSISSATEISGETSASLSIDPVNGYDVNQFYCLITEGTCQRYSNAAQLEELPNSRVYFRSAASGNWNGSGVWEFATTAGGPWSVACIWPTADNSSNVLIQTGHTVTISGQDIEIDELTVDVGGSLVLSATDAITLNNGPGVDFTVNGTFTDNANSGAGNGVYSSGGATWQLGATGTLIKTNNSSFSIYRDNYEGAMSLIPTTANIIIRSIAGSNPSFTAVGNTFYPNLTFESTSGTWNPVALGSRFNGASDFPTIKGNLDIGGSGAGNVVIYNQNTNSTPLTVFGNVQIRAGNTLTNAGTSNGTGFDFKGDVLVNGTLTVQSASNANYLGLSGSVTQTVSGTGTMNIQNLRVNNTSVFGIDLQRNLTVGNELVMTDGNIQTGTNLLELGTSTANRGTLSHTDGFVLGRMRRWFSGTNTGDASGKFPMGVLAADYYDRSITLEYTSAPTSAGHLTVEFINSPMASVSAGLPILAANTGGATFDVEYVEDEGYWQIDNQTGTLTDGLYDINLTGEEFQTVTDVSNLTLLKRVGSGPWTCPGSHLAASGPVNKPVVARSGVTGFSNFGFGSGNTNPLPVELLSFTATPVNNIVDLAWTTASEINNDYFTIERSKDAIEFIEISKTSGAGNSTSIREYKDVDAQPLEGISYYRLKQTDFNGDFEYSPIVPVNFKKDGTYQIMWINYNEETHELNGAITGAVNEELLYNVYDMNGRLVAEGLLMPHSAFFNLSASLESRGVYLVRFFNRKGFNQSFKLVK